MEFSIGELICGVAIASVFFAAVVLLLVLQHFEIWRMQDKWERFIKETAAVEATRGKRVGALFTAVDSIRGTVKELPRVVNKKLDELYLSVKQELQDDVREMTRTHEDTGTEG